MSEVLSDVLPVLRELRRSGATVRDPATGELLGVVGVAEGPALRVLGHAPALAGRPLTPRHAEVLTVLTLAGRGLTAEELTLEVYGERGKPVTVRAEMSRLRHALPGTVSARPYALVAPLDSDFAACERMLAARHVGEAIAAYAERLLPHSEAPVVIEARDRLEQGLRSAARAHPDPGVLLAWCQSAAGALDEPAAVALLKRLAPNDARVPAARAHLQRVRRQMA